MKQKIIEAIENYCSYEDLDFRTDYSGRSMYGRKCIGIDCNYPMDTIMELVAYVIDDMQSYNSGITASEIVEEIGDAKIDNMGMGMILYFPSLRMEE